MKTVLILIEGVWLPALVTYNNQQRLHVSFSGSPASNMGEAWVWDPDAEASLTACLLFVEKLKIHVYEGKHVVSVEMLLPLQKQQGAATLSSKIAK